MHLANKTNAYEQQQQQKKKTQNEIPFFLKENKNEWVYGQK